jgi:hypothetical protein
MGVYACARPRFWRRLFDDAATWKATEMFRGLLYRRTGRA